MKITYWSHEQGKAGTTANLAAVSVMLALGQQRQSFLLENHYHVNNLETMLVPNHSQVLREDGYYYNQRGMDYIMRHIGSGQNPRTLIERAAVPLLQHHIRYIPQGPIFNKEVFAYQLQQQFFPLLHYLEDAADDLVIDVEARGNASTTMILSEADLVVVNLSQSQPAFEHFFSHYASLQQKAVYIIGQYRPDREFTLDKILKEFPIKKERIGILPYNEEFAHALSGGKLIPFLARNYQCGNFHRNYPLIKECKNCAKMIMDYAKHLPRFER